MPAAKRANSGDQYFYSPNCMPDPMVSASPGVQAGVSDAFLFGMVYILRVQKTYERIARK